MRVTHLIDMGRLAGLIVALATALAGCQKHAPGPADAPGRALLELRRGLGAEPETLDPLRATDNAALAVVGDLYEGLAREAADGSVVHGAAEAWSVSADGLTWVFRLRPDLRWSNGEPLTAAQFAASLEAALVPGTDLPNAPLLESVRAVEAPTAAELRVSLTRPVPYLPTLLALPMAAPSYPSAAATGVRPSNAARVRLLWEARPPW